MKHLFKSVSDLFSIEIGAVLLVIVTALILRLVRMYLEYINVTSTTALAVCYIGTLALLGSLALIYYRKVKQKRNK